MILTFRRLWTWMAGTWYDPEAATARVTRTEAAHQQAIRSRVATERLGRSLRESRLAILRDAADRSSQRLGR